MRSAGFEPATGNLRIISAHLFKSPIRGIPGWDGVYHYIHVRILYPRPESNRHALTAIDFESIVATITPRGFVWAFHVSQRSGPKYEKTFNIYSRRWPLCCPGTNRTCIVGTKIQCVSRCTTGQFNFYMYRKCKAVAYATFAARRPFAVVRIS